MKVEQFINKNQFHLYNCNGEKYDTDILQSYNSQVVLIKEKAYEKVITLGLKWDYSTTTSKHVYAFLEKYGNINFYGITNKRAYINKLINDGVIKYDENMD